MVQLHHSYKPRGCLTHGYKLKPIQIDKTLLQRPHTSTYDVQRTKYIITASISCHLITTCRVCLQRMPRAKSRGYQQVHVCLERNYLKIVTVAAPSGESVQRVLVTGSIARSANLPVFSLLRGRF